MDAFEQLQQQVEQHPHVEGLNPTDLLDLPTPLGGVLRKMMRKRRMTEAILAEEFALTAGQAHEIVLALTAKGFLLALPEGAGGETIYNLRFLPKKTPRGTANLWQLIDDKS